jgi:hypothetical protein
MLICNQIFEALLRRFQPNLPLHLLKGDEAGFDFTCLWILSAVAWA